MDATTVGALLACSCPELEVARVKCACVRSNKGSIERGGWSGGRSHLELPPVNSSLTHEQSINQIKPNQTNQLTTDQSRSTPRSGTQTGGSIPAPAQAPAFSRETQFILSARPIHTIPEPYLHGGSAPLPMGLASPNGNCFLTFSCHARQPASHPRSPHSSAGSKTQFPWKPLRPSSR